MKTREREKETTKRPNEQTYLLNSISITCTVRNVEMSSLASTERRVRVVVKGFIMTIKVGINGFGRIGRLVARFILETPGCNLELVHINELHGDAATSAYLLQFDSVHGRFAGFECSATEDGSSIKVVGPSAATTNTISFSSFESPNEIAACSEKNIDVVLECTGVLKSSKKLAPFFSKHGVKKVVVSAPIKEDGVPNVVVGVNDEVYKTGEHSIVTAASCTTNCIAPVVKVLHEYGPGIKHGSFTTLHDITNTQCILDTAWPGKKEIRRTRGCLTNLVPTTTGSAKAITQIFPSLTGLLDGRAVRIPLANASLTDCVFEMKKETTVDEINSLLQEHAKNGPLKGILGCEARPLVSSDFVNDPRSGIVDLMSTKCINKTQVKLYVWYDNEFGYARRMFDLAVRVGKEL